MSAKLFQPLKLRELVIPNRIILSPMCQYSAINGVPQSWHLVHLGARAAGGVGMVMVEATAVSPEGRISPLDTGLWNSEQMEAFRPVTQFIRDQGSVAAVQLAHAGRKACTAPPWEGGQYVPVSKGGWQPIAPSSIAFSSQHPVPEMMTHHEMERVKKDFVRAAERAFHAGFQVIEIHMAHGYLLHEFLSPLSNARMDDYGGTRENRMRYPLEVVRAVREVWPTDLPLFVRISVTDWVTGGWTLEDSVHLAREFKSLGVDLVDCSSGALVHDAVIPAGPGFQVPFAEMIRKEAELPTGAVGLITSPQQAEEVLVQGKADAIFIGRELLRDPHWPLKAAAELKIDVSWPKQYLRAKS